MGSCTPVLSTAGATPLQSGTVTLSQFSFFIYITCFHDVAMKKNDWQLGCVHYWMLTARTESQYQLCFTVETLPPISCSKIAPPLSCGSLALYCILWGKVTICLWQNFLPFNFKRMLVTQPQFVNFILGWLEVTIGVESILFIQKLKKTKQRKPGGGCNSWQRGVFFFTFLCLSVIQFYGIVCIIPQCSHHYKVRWSHVCLQKTSSHQSLMSAPRWKWRENCISFDV